MKLNSSRITYMKDRLGKKITIRDDWIEARTTRRQSAAHLSEWTGKTYFKVMAGRIENHQIAQLIKEWEENSQQGHECPPIMGESADEVPPSARGDSQNSAGNRESENERSDNKPKESTAGDSSNDGDDNGIKATPARTTAHEIGGDDEEEKTDLLQMLIGEEQEESRAVRERASGSRDEPDMGVEGELPDGEEHQEKENGDPNGVAAGEGGSEQAIEAVSERERRQADERRLKRRSGDPNEATTTQHLLTHFPKNIHCVSCRQAKVTNVRFTRRKKPRETSEDQAKFGKRVTADTIVLRNPKDRGINGETNAIVFYDLHTGWIECVPVRSRETSETVRAINHYNSED